jgi:hypothetical protein
LEVESMEPFGGIVPREKLARGKKSKNLTNKKKGTSVVIFTVLEG